MPSLLSGITVNTSPTDYDSTKQMRLLRFDGKRWVSFADGLKNRFGSARIGRGLTVAPRGPQREYLSSGFPMKGRFGTSSF